MNKKLKNLLKKILLSLTIFLLAIIIPLNIYIKISLYIASYLIVGYEILLKSFHNIRNGEIFDENLLMIIATFVAFILGEYTEAIAIILFYQIGEFFQSYAVNNSRKSISKLMNIRPDYANIEKDGEIIQTSPENININDIIIVKSGEKIPLDGIILDGESTINTSALTGESIPQTAVSGDMVLSGCINLSSTLKIKIIKTYSESTASKILDLIENATNKKAKIENFITKFAKYYTPIIVVLAFIIATFPPLIFNNETFSTWFYRAMVFLVLSCPCALVISVPLSFFAGIGLASKYGILIKGGNFLELLSKINCFVFDKTGTLTKGNFEVVKINNINISQEEFLKNASYAEYYSDHPIAKSIKNKYQQNIDIKQIIDTETIQGFGVKANINNNIIYIGNEKIMKKFNIDFAEVDDIGTIVYMAINNKYVGYLVISDQIKIDTLNSIKDFYNLGIKKIIMLTGDKKTVAKNIAEQLNISEFYSNLLPQEKVQELEKIMQNNKYKVAFVGDGINDAPVLARADIGIAMGGIGSDAAIEASDMVIINDKISSIIKAIKISRQTIKIAKQNIYFSISVKTAILILGVIGYTSIWGAVFADVGVSIIAILNALRILIKKI